MRRPAAASREEVPEADRLGDYPHPRETRVFFGHSAAERTFLDAYRSTRTHHAWLITGPEGVGKATLAYRIARFVLAHPDPSAPAVRLATDLGVPPQYPVAHQVEALSHPDLFVLRRTWDRARKRLLSVLSVDEIRKGLHFFAMTAGAGGWRIAIIDSADDMNTSAANALLKTLEEPPPRALLLLVSHAPGQLPSTIRSRCRTLRLGPLRQDDLTAAVASAGAETALSALCDADRRALVTLARGSVRRALTFLSGNGLALNRDIDAIVGGWPHLDERKVHALASRFSRAGADEDFTLALSLIGDWLTARLERQAQAGATPASLAHLAEVWEKIAHLAAETEVFHFDRKQVILNAFRLLGRAAS